jgi:hypothetical protein
MSFVYEEDAGQVSQADPLPVGGLYDSLHEMRREPRDISPPSQAAIVHKITTPLRY